MASDTIAQGVFEFLRKYPPFEHIAEEELLSLAEEVGMKYYAPEEAIIRKGEDTLPHFFVVKKGGVQIYEQLEDGSQNLWDHCDEGDVFGVRASIAQDAYIANAIATEETLLYTIPFDKFNDLLTDNPKAALYLAAGFASGNTVIRQDDPEQTSVRSLRRFLKPENKTPGLTRDQLEVDTIQVHIGKKIIDCTPQHTVREAAKIMTIFNVGSILITDEDKRPLGILTDTDFRKKVVSVEESIKNKPVSEVMSQPVRTIPPDLAVSEVMLYMISQRISHFCVTEDGTDKSPAIGVISQRDILIAQGNNPAVLAKQIRKTDSVERLAAIRDKAEQLVQSYLQREIGVPFISNIITEINDVLIHKASDMALAKLAADGWQKPDLAFCWLSLGSEGRREQLLRTDQDNALIYENPPKGKADTAHKFFQKYADEVCQILIACGFVKCPADMMANNPKWCQPVAVWQEYFDRWISIPDPQALLQSNIFFDFRPILGETQLADDLREFIFEKMNRNELFLAYLAKSALQNPPPLSFFRNFIVEKSGDHKNEFDIKARAMMPLADAARVLAYEFKLKSYGSTFQRFEEVGKKDENLHAICEAAAMAYEILLEQRALNGFKHQNSGRYINPNNFNKLERQTIRSIFKTIEKVQQLLETRYRLGFIRG